MLPHQSHRRRPLKLEVLESRQAPAIATFRSGDVATTVVDGQISAGSPATPSFGAVSLRVAGPTTTAGESQALLKFSGMFGVGPGQIPANATIVSAHLTLFADNGPQVALAKIDPHIMFKSWTPAVATWNYFGNGIQLNDVEARTLPTASALVGTGYALAGPGMQVDLQYWITTNNNLGWVVVSSDPTAERSFASSEHPDQARRPMLTIRYDLPGTGNPSYTQLSGVPPVATKLAWFDWSTDLRNRRLARVPNERPSTFHFAGNGNDITGEGTIESPWKSLAKAQQILNTAVGGVRLRFRRGDVWRGPDVMNVQTIHVTLEDYGDSALPNPRFTRFEVLDPRGWTYVDRNVYKYANVPLVGWLREAADGYSRIYYRAESSLDVSSRPYSWYYDEEGSDPASADQPTLYVNVNGDPFFVPGGLEVCPGDGVGWSTFADNIRMQNLRLEGQGMAPSGVGYGLKIGQRDAYWEFVGVGLEVFFTGYHAIGQIIQYFGSHGAVTLVDTRAGYCANRFGVGNIGSGDITVYVAYGDWGGNEYIQYNSEVTYGALPAWDWRTQPGLNHGVGFYSHIGQGGSLDLVIIEKTRVGPTPNPVYYINQIDNVRPAFQLSEVRAFIVDDQTGYIPSYWQKPDVAVINSILDRRFPPVANDGKYSGFYHGPFPVGGWLINCTMMLDASLQINAGFTVTNALSYDSTKYINCQFDIFNGPSDAYFRNPFIPASVYAQSSVMTNSILSLSSTGTNGVGLINDATHLVNNAYYLANPTTISTFQYTNDAGRVTLVARPAVGVAPSVSSPLYDAGADIGLEYDQLRRPRGLLKTIGPLTGEVLPRPTTVTALWGVIGDEINAGEILFASTIDRLQLGFSRPVDVAIGSMKLFSEAGVVPTIGFVYNSASASARWTLAEPLAQGQYNIELDGLPVLSFSVLPGDFDRDGRVTTTDLGVFRTYFGSTSVYCDINGTGVVDVVDFAIFRHAFGTSL